MQNLQKSLIIGNGGKEKLLFNRKTPPAEPAIYPKWIGVRGRKV